MTADLQDNHIFEICRQLGIDYKDETQSHLMYFVSEYIYKKNLINDWQFRSPNKDSNYWINHKEKKVTSEYPYLPDIQKKLKDHIALIEQKLKTTKTKDLTQFKEVLQQPTDDRLMEFVSGIRSEMTKEFLLERNGYFHHLFIQHKRGIERRMQDLKNRENIVLNLYGNEEEGKFDKSKVVAYLNY